MLKHLQWQLCELWYTYNHTFMFLWFKIFWESYYLCHYTIIITIALHRPGRELGGSMYARPSPKTLWSPLVRPACPRVPCHLTPARLIACHPICSPALSNPVSRYLVNWPLPAGPLIDASPFLQWVQSSKATWCPKATLVILYQCLYLACKALSSETHCF